MELSQEQLNLLIEGFRRHDLTETVSLPMEEFFDGQQLRIYTPLEKRVLGYMKSNLTALGINRYMDNFSIHHPVNMMMGADAIYIANEATALAEDEARTAHAVRRYMDWFAPLIETAMESYCETKGKIADDLDEEDLRYIADRVTTVINEELMSVVMQGQQFSALYDTAHELQTHDDFLNKRNFDSKNFYNQWTHCKTDVGAMLALDDDENRITLPSCDDDPVFLMMCKTFCETLDDVDMTIFHMRLQGYTHDEIAVKLGYKNHSAVTKRIQTIRNHWDEFMNAYEAK